MMRVLMLSEFFPPLLGGLELHVQTLARGLASEGHQVVVGTLKTDRAPELDQGFDVRPLAAAAGYLPLTQNRSRPFLPPTRDPLLTRGIARLIREVDPDIIHAHNWIASSVPRRREVPLVLTLHDYLLICARRTLFDKDDRTCPGPRGRSCVSCAAALYGPVRAALLTPATVAGRARLRPDHVIAISAAVAASCGPYVDAPLTILPPAIADPKVTVQSPGPGAADPMGMQLPDGPFVMYAGAPEIHKGTDVLLEAWRGGLVDVPLVMALTRPLLRPVPPNVITMALTRDQVLSAFARAAVVVVPSIWPEPFGSVAAEAMMVGTPVVATRVGGLKEVVRHGEDGLLIQPGSAAQLADAVNLVLGDDERRAAMSRSAAARGRTFQIQTLLPSFLDLYRQVIAAFPAR